MSRSSFLRLFVVVLITLVAVLWWRSGSTFVSQPSVADSATVSPVTTQSSAVVQPIVVPSSQANAVPVVQPPRLVPFEPDAKMVVRALRQDVRWEAAIPEPAFAGFRAWTREFAKAKTAEEKTAMMAEGLELAEQRRNQMADLIDQNPQRALELAVPVAVRRWLPADVVARLEEPVAGRGDLFVVAAVAAPGKSLTVRPVERSVTMKDGREFKAYTFGRRDLVPTRENIAVQGIALDGKLALTELPGRIMEPVEVADLRAAGGAAPVCPTSGLATSTTGEEVVMDWDGSEPTFFCGPKHALDELMAAAGDEAMAGGVTAQSANTEGTKKLLIIRVDFPDQPGQVVSDATLTTLIGNMVTHWTEMSYGKMTWTAFGAGSDITPTLRLPNGHASYTGFGTMLAAARTAATAAGYDYLNYTHEVVVTGDKPDVGFGGVAYVGARGAWLANSQWNLGVCSHEVGHNFGLNHSGFWDTDDGSVIGSGAAVEYGNPFDQMGGASSSMDAHFGARQKNYLDWLVDADVVKITADGTTTTRIRAFDRSAAAGDKAIAVDRTGTGNDYWIDYRQDYADTNLWMRDGVLLNWGDVTISNMKPLLLDWTPGTSSKDDCPVLIGRTFSDTAAGIHITPVLRGTDPDGTAWIDVTVNRGAFPGNQKPSVTMAATNLNPEVSASVTFTATATDPNGDTLGYHWDWGDGTFTANNSSAASKSWSTSGTRTVRCYVTDMKGLTTTGQVLIQVGTSSTFFIQGIVKTTAGALVEGVLVKADATHSDMTDSEGYYAITGLNAGSYTMTATKTGLSIQPDVLFFTNPVVVGPSKLNMNFIAPPGSPYFATMKAGLLDQGSNTGAVIVPVSDADTPVTSLTLTGTSSNVAVIPDASITFGTVGTTVRTVTAAAISTVSGPVNITITATDPEGGTNSYVWPVTVNAKPVNTVTTKTTPENTPVDIDLRTFVADDLTIDDQIGFDLQRARDGVVTLLPDGHTARFTPSPNYNGAASFRMITRDQSLGTRVLFLYDFEPPDLATDAKSTDQSNFNRTGTLEVAGVGGEYQYSADVPSVMAPWSTQSLSLSDAGTGAARLRRTLSATDLDYNDADWSFSAWVKRSTSDTDDFILHLGSGDGHGTEAELQLFFPAGSNTLRLQKWGSTLEKEIVGPNLNIGEWHHITLTYDRTGTDVGTFALYVDGFAYNTVASVAMNVSQSASLMVGGHNSTTASLDRWFDGKIEDALFQSGVNGRAEIWGLAHFSARHYNGLSATTTVNVTVTGTNQPPAITAVPDVYLPVSGVSAPVAFVLSDAENEARTLTVTAASSNTSLLPVSGIALSAAPPAWTSTDIGAVGATGSLTEDSGTFIIGGAGADIGPAAGDEFRWVRQDFTGDAEIITRVASMDHTNQDSKAGVMMRDSTTITSPYAFACVTPSGGVFFQYRATESTLAVIKATINAVAAPCWLRLVRTGSSFTAFYATDTNGVAGPWLPIGTAQAITFPAATNAIGLAVTSKVDASVCAAVFDHLGGTVDLGGERTVTDTPTAATSGTSIVTLTASDGATTSTRTFNVIVDGAPPSTTVWNAITTGSTLLWSTGGNWTGGVTPPSSRFSTAEFFTGQTFVAGTITSSNDTAIGHALNVLTLGGTGPTTGTATISITGNPIVLRRETTLFPVINLTATIGTGLTYNVSAPVTLDDTTTSQGAGTATFILSGGVNGAGGLTKTGTSRLILSGTSSYAGLTTITTGTLQIGNDGATGTLPAGDVINNASLRFDRTGTLLVPNNISGTGGLTIDCPINAGTVVLSGANSFTGGVSISSGALRIQNSSALGTTATTKTITLSAGSAGNCQLRLDGSGGAIDIAAGIRYTTSNNNGVIINEAGNNTLRGNITCASGGGDSKITVTAGTLTLEGNVTANTTGRTFVLGGAGAGFSNGILSNGTSTNVMGVTKADSGAWTISGTNTYSGTTSVSTGTLLLGNAKALGSGGIMFGSSFGGTSITAGATLNLNGQQGIQEVLTIRGTGEGGAGGLVNNSATAASIETGVSSISTVAGGTHSTVPLVTLTGNATATAALGVTAASFTINGGTTVYSAAPTVAITGGGGAGATATAVLTSGVVSGITITNAGTGFTTAPTIAFSAGTVTTPGTNPTGIGNATNFTVNGITVTSAGSGYTTAPTVTFSSGTGTTVTANMSAVVLGAAATIGSTGDITINADISGNFALTKAGNGILTINGASSNTTATTLNAGTLRGTGTFAGSLAINGGTHAPGNSTGITSTNASYTLAAAATLQMEINGTTPGTQHDQVGVAGTVTLAGTLDLIAAPALATDSTFTLINNTGASAVSGTFAGKPQNADFYENAQWWRISYTGGTGNDVVLTRITPSAWQTWQAATFGVNVNNPAISGDMADIDNDGSENLLEYATQMNPALNDIVPQTTTKNGANFEFVYTRNKSATDVTFIVEWSDTLSAASWSTVGVTQALIPGSDNGVTQQWKAEMPAGTTQRFVRLRVTRP